MKSNHVTAKQIKHLLQRQKQQHNKDIMMIIIMMIATYIYILGIVTEMFYSKSLERNVVYIPITTSNHATSVMSK